MQKNKRVLLQLKELPTLLNKLYMPVINKTTGKASIIKTKGGRESTKLIQMECIRQKANKRLEGRLSMKIDLCIKSKKKEPDIDAILKLLFDALEGVVYVNDKQITFLQVAKHTGQEIDEVIVLIEEK